MMKQEEIIDEAMQLIFANEKTDTLHEIVTVSMPFVRECLRSALNKLAPPKIDLNEVEKLVIDHANQTVGVAALSCHSLDVNKLVAEFRQRIGYQLTDLEQAERSGG